MEDARDVALEDVESVLDLNLVRLDVRCVGKVGSDRDRRSQADC